MFRFLIRRLKSFLLGRRAEKVNEKIAEVEKEFQKEKERNSEKHRELRIAFDEKIKSWKETFEKEKDFYLDFEEQSSLIFSELAKLMFEKDEFKIAKKVLARKQKIIQIQIDSEKEDLELIDEALVKLSKELNALEHWELARTLIPDLPKLEKNEEVFAYIKLLEDILKLDHKIQDSNNPKFIEDRNLLIKSSKYQFEETTSSSRLNCYGFGSQKQFLKLRKVIREKFLLYKELMELNRLKREKQSSISYFIKVSKAAKGEFEKKYNLEILDKRELDLKIKILKIIFSDWISIEKQLNYENKILENISNAKIPDVEFEVLEKDYGRIKQEISKKEKAKKNNENFFRTLFRTKEEKDRLKVSLSNEINMLKSDFFKLSTTWNDENLKMEKFNVQQKKVEKLRNRKEKVSNSCRDRFFTILKIISKYDFKLPFWSKSDSIDDLLRKQNIRF